MVRHRPTDKDTRQESHDGQEYLSRHEVEAVEQRLAPHCKSVDSTQRQRTDGTDNNRRHRYDDGSLLTGNYQFFVQERRRHLMQ